MEVKDINYNGRELIDIRNKKQTLKHHESSLSLFFTHFESSKLPSFLTSFWKNRETKVLNNEMVLFLEDLDKNIIKKNEKEEISFDLEKLLKRARHKDKKILKEIKSKLNSQESLVGCLSGTSLEKQIFETNPESLLIVNPSKFTNILANEGLQAIAYIQENLNHEGLFRTPGNNKELILLLKKIFQGTLVEDKASMDPCNNADLLKRLTERYHAIHDAGLLNNLKGVDQDKCFTFFNELYHTLHDYIKNEEGNEERNHNNRTTKYSLELVVPFIIKAFYDVGIISKEEVEKDEREFLFIDPRVTTMKYVSTRNLNFTPGSKIIH